MRYLLSFCILFFVISCKKNNSGTGDNTTIGFNPTTPTFRIGSTWTYHYRSFEPNGHVSGEDDVTLTIVKDTTINSSRYFVTSNNYYFTNKTDGYYEYDRNTHEEHLIYKLNSTDPYQGFYLTMPPSTCITAFNATIANLDTTYTSYGKTYDKLVSYILNNFSTNCQFLPTYSKEMYSPKFGVKIMSVFLSGTPAAESQLVELESFTY